MPMSFVRHQAVFIISFRELLDQTVCVFPNMLALIAHYPDANRTILLAGKNIDRRQGYQGMGFQKISSMIDQEAF